MFISTFSSLVAAGALKLGYRLAEQKKWLPGFFYHKAAMQELKKGDLQKAEYYNSIALQKKPALENAQVVKELIAMQKDYRVTSIKKLIAVEDEEIAALQHNIAENKRILTREMNYEKFLKISIPVLVLLITVCMFVWIYIIKEHIVFGYYSAVIWIIFLITGLVLNRTVLEKWRLDRSLTRQEREVSIVTCERELQARINNRNGLIEKLKMNL